MITPPEHSSSSVSDESSAKERLSVIVPCFNEALVLEHFFSVLCETCSGHPELDYEFIFVNDGSRDATQSLLESFAAKDARVVVVEFARNFGKEAAITAGLRESKGDLVVPIDADLQHPPAVIFDLVQRYREGGVDVVVAKRASRSTESALYKHLTALFYRLENAIGDCTMPRDAGDFRLMNRRVVDALCALPEKRRFMKGLYAWVGFKSAEVTYEVAERAGGASKFSPMRLVTLALNGLLDFSTFPLQFWVLAGLMISAVSLIFGTWILVKTLIFGAHLPGYASLMCAIVFLGGVQLVSIGIIGEYVGRVYSEVKARPSYVIRRVIREGKAA